MKTFFHKNFFLVLHYNENTFSIIQRMWEAFIVVSQGVNDTSELVYIHQDFLEAHGTDKFRTESEEILFKKFSSNF